MRKSRVLFIFDDMTKGCKWRLIKLCSSITISKTLFFCIRFLITNQIHVKKTKTLHSKNLILTHCEKRRWTQHNFITLLAQSARWPQILMTSRSTIMWQACCLTQLFNKEKDILFFIQKSHPSWPHFAVVAADRKHSRCFCDNCKYTHTHRWSTTFREFLSSWWQSEPSSVRSDKPNLCWRKSYMVTAALVWALRWSFIWRPFSSTTQIGTDQFWRNTREWIWWKIHF